MKTLQDFNFENKTVLIRVDFNVPINAEKQVTDKRRIESALPTIERIRTQGGKIVLMSHFGRPKGKANPDFSLKIILSTLSELLGQEVLFADNCIGDETKRKVARMQPKDILLLENLRFHSEETAGDEKFAKQLSTLGDIYINDAFGTSHRAHASTSTIADFFPEAKGIGLLLQKEIENADRVLHASDKPTTAIMGGAKVSDKITLIKNLIYKVDNIIIGGGMSYTFFKALGKEIGTSICEDDKLDTALEILSMAKAEGTKLLLPLDIKVADKFDNEAESYITPIDAIPQDYMGMDIGIETINLYHQIIMKSKTIIWNGPMGVFEFDNFSNGTLQITNSLVAATKEGAFTMIGGGDSAAAITKFGMEDKVSFVSTGGGALLEYMEGKELPGIKALS